MNEQAWKEQAAHLWREYNNGLERGESHDEALSFALAVIVQQAIAAERGEPVAEKALRVADELFTAALKLPADEQHLWLFSEEGMDAWQTIRGAIHGFDHECLSAPPTEAQIRADEQERIVSWLRNMGEERLKRRSATSAGGPDYDLGRATSYNYAADAIERGEHCRASKEADNGAG